MRSHCLVRRRHIMIIRALCYAICAASLLCPLQAQEAGPFPPTFWAVGAVDKDAPFLCLALSKGGAGRIAGTFTSLNPVRWTYDSLSGELSLSLSHLDSAMVRTLRDAVGKHVLAFDTLSHIVRFNVVLGQTIWILGSTLFRAADLDPDELAVARRLCKIGPARQRRRASSSS